MNSKEEKVAITNDMLASRNKRFGNYIIDFIIKFIISSSIVLVLGIVAEYTGEYSFVEWIDNMGTIGEYAFAYLILILYYLFFESITSRTIGKYITNTKVFMRDGSKPEADKILKRTLCRLIPFNEFSFLGNDGKGWHDNLSDTVVVDLKKYEEIKNTQLSLSEIGSDSSEFESFLR